ncbi:MAG: PhnD/SsuA/transferrin family substrate-binding protein, partial [Planctomycetota bacterium]
VYEGKFQDVMIQQLRVNSLDAICTGPGALRIMNEESPGKFRVLAESARVPGFALSIDKDLPASEKRKLVAALVGIGRNPEGKRALAAISGSAAGAADTLPTDAKEYFTANLLMQENKRLYNAQIPER